MCLTAFAAVVVRMLSVSDFRGHIGFARQLAETGAMLPHFGYHIVVFAVQAQQYDLAYALNAEGAGVILAPFHMTGFFAPTDFVTLAWRLVASVLFPLAAVACFPSVRADRRVQIGWATFLIGAAFGYLLAEGGRAGDGNFLWSGQLAAFVLFVATAVAVLRAAAAHLLI